MMTGDGKKFGMWHGTQLFTRNTADMFLCSWSAVMLVNCFAKKVGWIKLSLAVLFSTRSPCFSAQKRHTQESDELLSLWKIAIIRPDVSSRSAGRKKAPEAPLIQNFLRHHTHHKWFDFVEPMARLLRNRKWPWTWISDEWSCCSSQIKIGGTTSVCDELDWGSSQNHTVFKTLDQFFTDSFHTCAWGTGWFVMNLSQVHHKSRFLWIGHFVMNNHVVLICDEPQSSSSQITGWD